MFRIITFSRQLNAVAGRAAMLAVSILLAGCMANAPLQPPIQAEQMTSQGLLVGTLAGGASSPSYLKSVVKVMVDGEAHTAVLHGGTFMLSLPPGEHQLNYFYYYSSGISAKYPVNLKFSINQGRITTLGAMFFLSEKLAGQSDEYKSYHVLQLENDAYIQRYLKRYHAALLTSLPDTTLYPSPQKRLAPAELLWLRQLIAFADSRALYSDSGGTHFIIGNLGTAGWVKNDAAGNPARFDPLPLDTLEEVIDCDLLSTRYACLTLTRWDNDENFERRVLLYADGRAVPFTPPAGANPLTIKLFAEQGLAMGDPDFKLYVRTGADAEWQVFDDPAAEIGFLTSRYRFADKPNGFYTYYEGKDSYLAFTDSQTGETHPVSLPKEFGESRYMLATRYGLVLGPDVKMMSDNVLYWRSDITGEWQLITPPDSKCHAVTQNRAKTEIYAVCGAGAYRSSDEGKTWHRRD